MNWWRRWESNPRPKIHSKWFLRAHLPEDSHRCRLLTAQLASASPWIVNGSGQLPKTDPCFHERQLRASRWTRRDVRQVVPRVYETLLPIKQQTPFRKKNCLLRLYLGACFLQWPAHWLAYTLLQYPRRNLYAPVKRGDLLFECAGWHRVLQCCDAGHKASSLWPTQAQDSRGRF